MKQFLFLLFLPLVFFAQEDPSPQQVQQQLDTAEEEFQNAKKMFNPWYAGPLLTGSAHMMPPGYANIQPYLFVTDYYAQFNSHHHSVDTPDRVQVNPQILYQTGITDQLDIFAGQSVVLNWQNEKFGSSCGDTNVTLGLCVLKEELYVPAIKLGIGENFPTGSYSNLRSNGLEATGAGVYATSLSFRIAKLLFWSTQHPLNTRATFTYTFPSSRASVRNFNSYGGGEGTKGKVRPGNQFNLSVGLEWSFTQRWVFANDFVFVHNDRSKFVGQTTAAVGSPSTEQFSLAPAIEYNPSAYLGFVGGLWFTVTGRNSSNFLSGVLTVTYTFKVN